MTIRGGVGPSDINDDWSEGGAILCAASPTITDCIITENSAYIGGGILCWGSGAGITNCLFRSNSATIGNGISINWTGHVTVRRCTFIDNRPGTAIHCAAGSPRIVNCTLYGNGGGIVVEQWGSNPVIENTIIMNCNRRRPVECDPIYGGEATLICCDILGNAQGDWVGCIADQYGVNGDFSEDPRFCDPDNGDFTLDETSPCRPCNSPAGCDLIGAHPVGCAYAGVDPGHNESTPWSSIKSMYK